MDDSLIERLQSADEAAWATLLDEYYERIVLFCGRYVMDPGEARALAHDSFIKARQKIASYKTDTSLSGWLYAISRNTALDYVRRDKRYDRNVSLSPSQTATGRMLLQPTAQESGPQTAANRSYTYEALLTCVDSLSEIHSEVVMLRYIDGLSRSEIAVVLGIPENTVKSRLLHALRTLRDIVPADLLDRN